MRRISAIFILLWGSTAAAENLVEIYQRAQQSDPQVRAAAAALEAARTARPQARAQLLPDLTLSAETKDNSQDSTLSGEQDFNSNGYALTLRQPVFHYNRFIALRKADAGIRQAQADFAATEQDLILRVSERYFGVLAARDSLEFARAETRAIGRQLEQAQKRFEVGLIAVTDKHEAKAAFDLAKTREIAAENELEARREALMELTGAPTQQLTGLGTELPLAEPEPADLDAWTQVAGEQNLRLQAAVYATEAAQQEVRIRRAGHYPTVDLVAERSNADVGGDFAREVDNDSIALQLNVPIYQGGGVQARTREATHLRTQARELQEQQRRATVRQTRDAYRGVFNAISQVQAFNQAMLSSQSALEATQAGFEVGTRTIVDVLDAQREVLRAQRDYAQARYDYILNTLRLKQAAGTLAPTDLQHVNRWLK